MDTSWSNFLFQVSVTDVELLVCGVVGGLQTCCQGVGLAWLGEEKERRGHCEWDEGKSSQPWGRSNPAFWCNITHDTGLLRSQLR